MIRYHNWNDINDEDEAKGFADSWRPELQGYLHATGPSPAWI